MKLLMIPQGFVLVLAATFVVAKVDAVAPPHPNYTNWESVYALRRRLNITFNYQPSHISDEHCRHLSEEQCRTDDEAAAGAKAQRVLASSTPASGFTHGNHLKVLVLLCRFSDHANRQLPTRAYYDELFNGAGLSAVNPVGSIRQWMYFNSVGKYNVTYDVHDWKTTVNTEAYYAGGMSGLRGADAMQEMFKPLLDDLYKSGYNFAPLSSDGWGDLDHFVVVHSGYPAEYGDPKDGCTNMAVNRIWSQGIQSTANGWMSTDGSFTVSTYLLVGAFAEGLCKANPVEMGVCSHEYMHGFGLIDLYDLDTNEPKIPLGGTGKFGIMSNLHGWNHNSKIPGHMSAYSKVEATWLEPIEITENGYYPIQPCEISSQIYTIKKNFPTGEYLLIENRQPMMWDSDWDSSGIVIFKVDKNADGQKLRGYPGHPNWPQNHYEVAVLQADGLYEIEKGISPGNAGDFWTMGQKLGPGPSWPNTAGFSFGIVAETGITIEIMSKSQFIMLIRVTGL